MSRPLRILVVGPTAGQFAPEALAVEAVKALVARGHEVSVLHASPSSPLSDPALVPHTWLEPVTLEAVTRIREASAFDMIFGQFGGVSGASLLKGLPNLIGTAPEQFEVSQPGVRLHVEVARDARGATLAIGALELLDGRRVMPVSSLSSPELEQACSAAVAAVSTRCLVGVVGVRLVVPSAGGSAQLSEIVPALSAESAVLAQVTGAKLGAAAALLPLGDSLASLGLTAVKPQHSAATWQHPDGLGEALGFGTTKSEALGRAQKAIESAREVLAPAEGPLAKAGAAPAPGSTLVVVGAGPTRVGQGAEFDWSAAQAAKSLTAAGFKVVLHNPNPFAFAEGVKRVFAPVTAADVLQTVRTENAAGVLLQFGGQGPLALANALAREGVALLGVGSETLDRCENRERFAGLVEKLGLLQPQCAFATTLDEAIAATTTLGFPLLLRPSWVSGGYAMEVVWDLKSLRAGFGRAVDASLGRPVRLDRFLEEATEVDVDLLRDGTGRVVVCGVMEHVEQAGVHSGDAAVVLPPHSLSPEVKERLEDRAVALAGELGLEGPLNVQFAVQGKAVYVLEVNARASRNLPFISRALGIDVAAIAARCVTGSSLDSLGFTRAPKVHHVAVKEAVFSFARPSSADVQLGPQMKSTGEVMGLGTSVAAAFGKSQLAAGTRLPSSGRVVVAVDEVDFPAVVDLTKRLHALGFTVISPEATHGYLSKKKAPVTLEASCEARVRSGEVALVVSTVGHAPESGTEALGLRRAALEYGLPYFTTVEAARLAVAALETQAAHGASYRPLQQWLNG